MQYLLLLVIKKVSGVVAEPIVILVLTGIPATSLFMSSVTPILKRKLYLKKVGFFSSKVTQKLKKN